MLIPRIVSLCMEGSLIRSEDRMADARPCIKVKAATLQCDESTEFGLPRERLDIQYVQQCSCKSKCLFFPGILGSDGFVTGLPKRPVCSIFFTMLNHQSL